MANRLRPERRQRDDEDHPIAWFSALLRGVDRQDKALVEEAQDRLEGLGYFVVPMPPKDPGTKGAA
jgi:hypothetical protein